MKKSFLILLSFLILSQACATTQKKPLPQPIEQAAPTMEKGEALIKSENYEEAQNVFTQIVQENPANAKAHYYLGFSQYQNNLLQEAMSSYQRALEIDDSLIEAIINLGLVYMETQEFQQALNLLTKALEMEPDAQDILFNIGITMGNMKKYPQAQDYLEQALEQDPTDYDSILASASFYLEDDKKEKALHRLSSLSDMNLDGFTLAQAGLMAAKAGGSQVATSLYEQALKIDSEYVKTHVLLGNLLARSNDFESALFHFEKYLEKAPNGEDSEAAKKAIEACKAKLGNK